MRANPGRSIRKAELDVKPVAFWPVQYEPDYLLDGEEEVIEVACLSVCTGEVEHVCDPHASLMGHLNFVRHSLSPIPSYRQQIIATDFWATHSDGLPTPSEPQASQEVARS